MTPEEKKQLELITKLAIDRLHVESRIDDCELYEQMHQIREFKAFCAAGLHEALEESGFTGDIVDDAQVTMTVKQLYGSLVSSITIGMDLAVMMARYGAKFPVQKTN